MFKKFGALVLVLAATSAHADQAVSIGFGTYNLYRDADANVQNSDCVLGSKLDIVNGETSPALRLVDFVKGTCRIAVIPNPRQYELVAVEDAGCGSKRYLGIRRDTENKLSTVSLIDHRTRVCKDVVKNLLVLEEQVNLKPVDTFYHVLGVIKPGQMVCQAFWSGFEMNSFTNQCEKRGTSGCANPFRFTDKESCEAYFNL